MLLLTLRSYILSYFTMLSATYGYFDALFEVVENRDLEYASRGFARLLMPTAIAHPDLESAGRAALERAGAGAAPVLLRILLEEVDEMARAVRLRAL